MQLLEQPVHSSASLDLLQARTRRLVEQLRRHLGGAGAWTFPKLVAAFNYADDIRRFGGTSLTSTQAQERGLKPLKRAYQATNKQHASLPRQLVNVVRGHEAADTLAAATAARARAADPAAAEEEQLDEDSSCSGAADGVRKNCASVRAAFRLDLAALPPTPFTRTHSARSDALAQLLQQVPSLAHLRPALAAWMRDCALPGAAPTHVGVLRLLRVPTLLGITDYVRSHPAFMQRGSVPELSDVQIHISPASTRGAATAEYGYGQVQALLRVPLAATTAAYPRGHADLAFVRWYEEVCQDDGSLPIACPQLRWWAAH